MKRCICILLMTVNILIFTPSVLFSDEVKVTEPGPHSGKSAILIENDFYEMCFEPDSGGRLSSLVLKSTGKEQALQEKHGGFFLDHFVGGAYPGEFIYSPYEVKVLHNDDKSVSLQMWRVSTGKANSDSNAKSGLRVQKTITIYPDKPVLDAEYSVTNTTSEDKSFAMWFQQCAAIGGSNIENTYYRPTVRGINTIGTDEKGVKQGGEDWVTDFTGGWVAARGSKSDEGIVFLLDYDSLHKIYNSNGSTAEWFAYSVVLPPGKTWSTRYSIVPVRGFRNFVNATKRVISDIEIVQAKDSVNFNYLLAAASERIADLDIRTTVYKVRSKKSENLPAIKIKNLGYSSSKANVQLKGKLSEPIVLRVEMSDGSWSETYEYLYWGGFEGGGIGGYVAHDEYLIPKPRQQVRLLESETDLRVTRNKSLDVLMFYGLYSNFYEIDKAVNNIKPSAIRVSNAPSGGIEYMPNGMKELMQYDLVVLSDVDKECLKDVGDLMLARYVKAGGGLLVLGGPNTLGQGNFENSDLSSVLPVVLQSRFDIRRESEGAALRPQETDDISKGVEFTGSPAVYWIHEVTPKPDAKVLVQAGSRPFLITGTYGNGRVAVITGTPMGEASRGQTEFWRWNGWQGLITNTLKWLGEER